MHAKIAGPCPPPPPVPSLPLPSFPIFPARDVNPSPPRPLPTITTESHTQQLSACSTTLHRGSNEYGQLGIGSTVAVVGDAATAASNMGDNAVKVDYGNDSEFPIRFMSCGNSHVCLAHDTTSSGDFIPGNYGYKCWGRNHKGQLGYGDTTDRGSDPSHMGSNLQFLDFGSDGGEFLQAGADFTCVRSRLPGDFSYDKMTMYCFGDNSEKQLGLSDTSIIIGDEAGEVATQAAITPQFPSECGSPLVSPVSGGWGFLGFAMMKGTVCFSCGPGGSPARDDSVFCR